MKGGGFFKVNSKITVGGMTAIVARHPDSSYTPHLLVLVPCILSSYTVLGLVFVTNSIQHKGCYFTSKVRL